MLKSFFVALLCALAISMTPARAQSVADYRDVAEIESTIDAMNGALDGRVSIIVPGRTEQGRRLQVIAFGAASQPNGRPQLTRQGTRPGFLIECNMHAREWATAEVCLKFTEDLISFHQLGPLLRAFGLTGPLTEVDLILDRIDLFVMPLANPDGRAFDDTDGGDPYRFDNSNQAAGWRRNRGTYFCASIMANLIGIDLARNFSVGWSQIPAGSRELNCADSKYRGPAPFAARETRLFRKFVNNHMIGQILSVHGNAQGFDTVVSPGFGSAGVQAFLGQFNGNLANPLLTIGNGPGGGGFGQVPAWASGTSNASGAPDEGTRRGINAYMLEIPIADATYQGSVYELTPTARDRNGFRPTNARFLEDMRLPMMMSTLYLARQAATPWRMVNPVTNVPVPCAASPCPVDFALVGSRIVNAPQRFGLSNAGGILRMRNTPDPHEWVRAGRLRAVVGVQNATASGARTARTVMFSMEDISNIAAPVTLSPLDGGNGVLAVALAPGQSRRLNGPRYEVVAGREYRMTIVLQAGDADAQNDLHVFRFRAR